ncbi:hypothetical protein P5G51_000390 [Virgibacillus sp. 179-BFC.A HS]|uniref:Uncharacterized protein n=1 Tax=Tigheibacillus jepli TaxID=3035914 RepID=A0ABU5CCL8_9BACI|nr:hypothetical protein [Virgibacillus sp. 179-BFC.A HS]MDY0404073.1 hypothetical protein [Virgibacillus sp. 179-BFC.A HS]
MGNLTDIEASEIALESYDSSLEKVQLVINQKHIEWKKVDTIQDPTTGLQGYTLKNKDTGEVVISFEGTQLYRGVDQAVSDINEDFLESYLVDLTTPSVNKTLSATTVPRVRMQE